MLRDIDFRRRRPAWLVAAAVLLSLLAACAAPHVAKLPPPAAPMLPFNPAGDWEYEEQGRVLPLTLDDQGNGTYPWKDGEIITTEIDGRQWTGVWKQAGNDREGGFALTLSDDLQRAEGRWWYTRIGSDTSPQRKGGTFTLTRLQGPKRRETGSTGY